MGKFTSGTVLTYSQRLTSFGHGNLLAESHQGMVKVIDTIMVEAIQIAKGDLLEPTKLHKDLFKKLVFAILAIDPEYHTYKHYF